MADSHSTTPRPVESRGVFLGQITLNLSDLVERTLARTNLHACDFSDEHCDCHELATVHHLASELEFCLYHFRAVTR